MRHQLLVGGEGSSLLSVLSNLINGIIGAGIVGLPYTMKQGGVALTSIIIVFMA